MQLVILRDTVVILHPSFTLKEKSLTYCLYHMSRPFLNRLKKTRQAEDGQARENLFSFAPPGIEPTLSAASSFKRTCLVFSLRYTHPSQATCNFLFTLMRHVLTSTGELGDCLAKDANSLVQIPDRQGHLMHSLHHLIDRDLALMFSSDDVLLLTNISKCKSCWFLYMSYVTC